MKWILFAFTVVVLGCLVTSMPDYDAKTQKYLENLKKNGYNANSLPTFSNGTEIPTNVNYTMILWSVSKIDEVNMVYEAEFFNWMWWNDSRLAFPNEDYEDIWLRESKHIWTPELLYAQEKARIIDHLNDENLNLKHCININKSGEVAYGERMRVVFSCQMDFRKYPHDTQKCLIDVYGNGYGQGHPVKLVWTSIKHYHYTINPNITDLLYYKIVDINEKKNTNGDDSDDCPNVKVEITFQRKVGFFMTRLYVPFIFLTVLTWLSFWIPAKMAMPRLSLLFVIMYFMVHIGLDINAKVPMTSYTKGSDVWIAVCETMVFAAFLEFIAALVFGKYEDNVQNENKDTEENEFLNGDVKKNPVYSEPPPSTNKNTVHLIAKRLKTQVVMQQGRIDKVSSVLFPVIFIGFNIVYWIVYCA